MQPAVKQALQRAQELLLELGLTVTQQPTPGLDLTAARMGGFIESAREAAETFGADRAAGGISQSFAMSLAYGAAATPEVLAAGEAAMAAAKDAVLDALAQADVILMPTSPQAAFPHGKSSVTQADFTALANLAGVPSLSIPAGFDADGLPVAVQLVGPAGGEGMLIELGCRLDRALGAYKAPANYA
jgi:aspartyl-tRNA(Asn)/glutamyl-tRNA(Gln) amidotransferase subunit A